jgi:hypothetical protein
LPFPESFQNASGYDARHRQALHVDHQSIMNNRLMGGGCPQGRAVACIKTAQIMT